MKQFIVMMAVLPILLIFMLQIGFDQRNAYMVNQIESVMYSAKELAKQEGRFSAENVKTLKNDIAKACGIDASEVVFTSSDGVKSRYAQRAEDRLIYYRLEVPLKNVMAGAGFFGISDSDNAYTYVIDSYTASERI